MADKRPGYDNSNHILTTGDHPDGKAIRCRLAATEVAGRPAEPVMATLTSATHTQSGEGQQNQTGLMQEIREFWRQFIVAAFDPYRPEQHYMRGPGPACRAKSRAARSR
jgi:hypothetical protein